MYRLVIHIHGDCKEFWKRYDSFWKKHDYDMIKYNIGKTGVYTVHKMVLMVDGEKLSETGYQNMKTDKVEKMVFETPSEKLYAELLRLTENIECVET